MNQEKQQQLSELIGSLQTPTPSVTPSWTEDKGRVSGPVSGVIYEYVVGLTMEDLIRNARSWNQFKSTLTDDMLGFLILMLSCEDGSLGGFFIDKDPETERGGYEAVLRAIARSTTRIEKMTKEDYDLIKKFVVPSRYLNLAHQRDIRDMMERIKNDLDSAEKAKSQKRKKGDEDDEEDLIAVDDPIPAPKVVSGMQFPVDRKIWDFFPSLKWFNRGSFKGAKSDLVSGISEDTCCIDNNVFFTFIRPAASDSNQLEDLLLSSEFGRGGSLVVPKVILCVSMMRDEDDNLVGVLARFLQLDPTWNPGKEIHKIIKQVTDRKTSWQKSWYEEPWPQYSHLMNTGFPTHNLTWDRWVDVCNRVNYTGPQDYHDRLKHMSSRADTWTSEFHPKNVFTLERALSKLKDAGAVVGDFALYSDSANKQALWPPHVQSVTVHYAPEQVFWDSTDYVGFCNQYFPFVSQPHPSLANMLLERPVLRKDAIMSKLPKAPYKTGNILVHMEYEAKLFGGNVYSKLPSNLYTLYQLGEATEDADAYRDYCRALHAFQSQNMDKLMGVCTMEGNVDCLPISGPMKAVTRYLQDYLQKNKHTTFEIKLVDRNLSFFGNAVVRETFQIYNCFGIIRVMISFKTQGLFCVAQRMAAKLLWNYVLFGEKASGKSVSGPGFVCKLFIPGTFQKLDRRTAAADQNDGGVMDLVEVEEEMDEAYVDPKVAAKNKEKVNLKKSAMTTGTTEVARYESVKVPGVGEFSGTRITQSIRKSVTMGTTNQQDVKDDALASRFFKETITQVDIPTNEMRKDIDPQDEQKAIDSFRIYQAISYWVDKAMAIQAICPEPNMDLWHDVVNRVFEPLNVWGVLDRANNGRVIEIMTNFARQMVIKNAINMTYNVRGARYFEVPFDPSHMKWLQRYLYCTTDITLFTLTALSNEIIRDNLGIVLNALYKVVSSSTQDWDGSKTPYQLYQEDVDGRIKWKLEDNVAYNKDRDKKSNAKLTNLNMMRIDANKSDVARQISHMTHLAASDCEGALDRMAGMSFPPNFSGRNGYIPYPCTDLERHKAYTQPKIQLKMLSFREQIRTFVNDLRTIYVGPLVQKIDPTVQTLSECESYVSRKNLTNGEIVLLYADREYWNATDDQLIGTLNDLKLSAMSEERIKVAMSLFSDFTALPGIDYTASAAQIGLDYMHLRFLELGMEQGIFFRTGDTECTYLARRVLDGNDVNPFPHFACESDIPQLNNVRANDAPGSRMIPVVDLHSTKSVAFSPLAILLFDKRIILEAFEQAVMCATTSPGKRLLGWPLQGDPSKVETMNWTQDYIHDTVRKLNANMPANGVNRLNGVTFRRRGYITTAASEFLGHVAANHTNVETIDDLDKWSATVQHMRCGFSLDEPVHDPKWIHENYIKHGGYLGTQDYPRSVSQEEQKHEQANWIPNFNYQRLKN